jgi:hypothetical protein
MRRPRAAGARVQGSDPPPPPERNGVPPLTMRLRPLSEFALLQIPYTAGGSYTLCGVSIGEEGSSVTKVLSLRVADDLAEWASAYAKERGVTRQALIEGALRSFREDCQGGVPEVPRGPREVVEYPMDERVPRPIAPPPRQRLARSEQSKLAMERMRRMNPNRYGGAA